MAIYGCILGGYNGLLMAITLYPIRATIYACFLFNPGGRELSVSSYLVLPQFHMSYEGCVAITLVWNLDDFCMYNDCLLNKFIFVCTLTSIDIFNQLIIIMSNVTSAPTIDDQSFSKVSQRS